MSRRIDLDAYGPGVEILAGRSRGREARARERLDDADRERTPVEIVLPGRLLAVSSSFLLGMLEDSVAALGSSGFRERYSFTGRDAHRIKEDLIQTAMLMGQPIRPVRRHRPRGSSH
jgi:hypothetical protein